jgi:hypothetical protein
MAAFECRSSSRRICSMRRGWACVSLWHPMT